MMTIELTNADYVRSELARLQVNIAGLDGASAQVGSDLPYSYGIVTGWKRNGQLARRAGGSFSLHQALDIVRPFIGPALMVSILLGKGRVVATLTALATQIRQETQQREVVKSGALRASYVVLVRPGR